MLFIVKVIMFNKFYEYPQVNCGKQKHPAFNWVFSSYTKTSELIPIKSLLLFIIGFTMFSIKSIT